MPIPSPEERPDLYDYEDCRPGGAGTGLSDRVLPPYILERMKVVAAEKAARAEAEEETK